MSPSRKRVEQQRAHARTREHALRHDDAADERAGVDRDHGDERRRRAAQPVLPHDASLGEALGARGADVIAVELVAERGALVPAPAGDELHRQHEHGEEQLAEVVDRPRCPPGFGIE